jgi:ribosomal protein S18 acetylase RimI-like enzyme
MLNLRKMSLEEFEKFEITSKQSYKQDKIRANGFTEVEAQKVADEGFLRLLPKGYNSEDTFLFMVENSENKAIGHLWYLVQGAENNRKAFIADILIFEEFQGKGLGKETMLLLEVEAKKQKLKSIGLHVFAFNERAIGLYKSLNYQITDLVMEKAL